MQELRGKIADLRAENADLKAGNAELRARIETLETTNDISNPQRGYGDDAMKRKGAALEGGGAG